MSMDHGACARNKNRALVRPGRRRRCHTKIKTCAIPLCQVSAIIAVTAPSDEIVTNGNFRYGTLACRSPHVHMSLVYMHMPSRHMPTYYLVGVLFIQLTYQCHHARGTGYILPREAFRGPLGWGQLGVVPHTRAFYQKAHQKEAAPRSHPKRATHLTSRTTQDKRNKKTRPPSGFLRLPSWLARVLS